MRFLNKRTLLLTFSIVALIVLVAIGVSVVYLNSPRFNERVRQSIVHEIETRTGAKVSLARVQWALLKQRVVLENLTVRGAEPPEGLPLAHIESITAGINLRSLLQRRINLFELTIRRPEFRLLVDPQGKTNLPTPPPSLGPGEFDFQTSIENFSIADGQAFINDRRMNLDFTLRNLVAALTYKSATQVLAMQFGYDGTLQLKGKPAIPYGLSATVDYTRGTAVAHQVEVKSGKSVFKLQGRVDDVFTNNILGRMEYTGNAEVQFLNYFFEKEVFEGTSDATGSLEFSRGYFFTKGNAASNSVTFEGWNGRAIKTEYSYHYPGRRLSLRRLTARIAEGTAAGNVAIEPLPGAPRVTLDLDYNDIDAALLARVYPWDPKYTIYSRLTGQLQGWFQGKFDRFELGGDANLTAYPPQPSPGVIAFPIDGSTGYLARPGQVQVTNADIRFFSTSIQAAGLITETTADLTVNLNSSNLANLYFVYGNANGAGSFTGTLTGPLKTPLFEGAVVLDGHKHREWTIQHAAGNVRLDTLSEDAILRNMQVTLGQSQATINGTAKLDGSVVDLRIQAADVRGEDLASLVNQKIGGIFSGDIRLTSTNPIRFDGRASANGLVVEGRALGNVQADLKFDDPTIDIQNLRAADRGATLTGNITYNRNTEALRFGVRLSSLDLTRLQDLGVPDTLQGVIQQADLRGSGTRLRPEINGEGVVQNLSFHGETFPQARLALATAWPTMTLSLMEAGNVDLSARIDVSANGYPFDAIARFRNYSIENLSGFSQGTLIASGEANLKGLLTETSRLQGAGTIQSAELRIQDYAFRATQPFKFAFDTERVTLSKLSLDGGLGTQIDIEGTVGLTKNASLDLTAKGDLDLAVLAAADPDWSVTGIVALDGHIGGTPNNPDLSGYARITKASFGREGIYTTLYDLNGDVTFRGTRVNLENLQGTVGGGAIRVQGSGVIRNNQMEALDIRIETDNVRLRYPEGLRTRVNGTLLLRGSWAAPSLEGDLQIQEMAYRSEFEQFLALFQTGGLTSGGSALDRLRLSVHIAGNRNIVVKNQLADVEARVSLDIKGTAGTPAMIGEVEVSGGTLLFQGTRYEITRGIINFVSPFRIDPIVDIQAETELRDYRVILSITGRGDKLRLNMRSDPPLPQLEIVSLIAGGRTREELATEFGVSSLPTSEQLFQGGAASILLDLLRSKVGGGRFSMLGLDRVRIDPYLVGAGNNPSARITLSEQVTKDLSVTYSQDVASNQQRVILIEYFLSKNLSIVASREENSETTALGLDMRWRKRF